MIPDQIPVDLVVKFGGAIATALVAAVVGIFKILMATKDKAAADVVGQWEQRLKTEQEWRIQVERDRDAYRDLAWRITRVGESVLAPPQERR